jgi:hypothetical protein
MCGGVQMPADWEPVKAAVLARSLHIGPFPFTETIESIGTLFSLHGGVNQVRLLRYADPSCKGGHFAGTVIVEMATQEAADALLAKNIEHAGAPLRIQTRAAYQAKLVEVRCCVVWKPGFT